jgi:hypothetical protein
MKDVYKAPRKVTAAAIAGLASISLLASGCGSPKPKADATICTGLEFTAPKGGLGSVLVEVYPVFNRTFGDARRQIVDGKIISGTDTQTNITPSQYGNFGQLFFDFNPASKQILNAVVEATDTLDGISYTCKQTTMRFNAATYRVSPELPGSPF